MKLNKLLLHRQKEKKVADLTSKVKAKYKRSHPDCSLRDLERKGYKD